MKKIIKIYEKKIIKLNYLKIQIMNAILILKHFRPKKSKKNYLSI